MQRRDFLAASTLAATAAATATLPARAQAPAGARQFYEWRTYRFDEALRPVPGGDRTFQNRPQEYYDAKHGLVTKYLETAALPAWQRMGVGPVGVFKEVGRDAKPSLHVLLTYPTLELVGTAREALEADPEYQKNAVDYLAAEKEDPAFQRIDSQLLVAFTGWPQITAPKQGPRILEVRTYESYNEERARAKIKMFNSGEMPIFQKCGFENVFFGEALIGAGLPHLTYMLAAPDMAANEAGWQKFINHPDWAKMKDLPEYKDTVSNIRKLYLEPLPFSQI